MSELWDLYDENRNLLDKTIQRGEDIPEGCYHVVVHCCIFNSERKMLCQQRSEDKEGFPSYWDVTCGGCALKGETSQKAIQRELNEELGIFADFTDYSPIFTLKGPGVFDDYYFIYSDVDLNELTLQTEEVSDVDYLTFEQIDRMLDSDAFIPYAHLSFIKDLANKYIFNQQ